MNKANILGEQNTRTKTNERLRYLGIKLDHLKRIDVSSYLNPQIIEPLESELLVSPHYQKRPPKGYPSSPGERLGLRRVTDTKEGVYDKLPLRIGKTELHVQEAGSENNLESAVILRLGNIEKLDLGSSLPRLGTAKEVVGAFLHENGVISACYLPNQMVYAVYLSWYPKGKEGLGGVPYPSDRKEILETMDECLENARNVVGCPIQKGDGFYKVPDLVMLAVDAYESVGK